MTHRLDSLAFILCALFAAHPVRAAVPSAAYDCDPLDEALPCPPDPAGRLSEEDQDLDTEGIDGREPLPNFHEVAPGIFRSGQPGREGLDQMAQRGVKTVLSLRFWRARGESAESRRLGMRSASVSMDGFSSPGFWQVDAALRVLTQPDLRPVLVHCKFGKDRTGVVVAAYRVVVEGWTPRAAAEEAKRIGCCAPIFEDLEPWLKAYKDHRRDLERGPGLPGPWPRPQTFKSQGVRGLRAVAGADTTGGLFFDGSVLRDAAHFAPAVSPPPPPLAAIGVHEDFSGRAGPKAVPGEGGVWGSAPALPSPSRPAGEEPRPDRMDAARRAALVARAKSVLEKNRESFQTERGVVRFTAPDKSRYPYQWLWDSSFHAIGLRHYDPARAADEVRSLLAGQWDNGMIPNMVHARADLLRKRRWNDFKDSLGQLRVGRALSSLRGSVSMLFQDKFLSLLHNRKTWSSGITQPPIVAEAALDVAAKLEPAERKAFLAEVYPGLRRYYDWIDRERVRDGLMVVYHSWETGTDNSPRFDPIYGVDPAKFREGWFNLTKKLPAILAFKRAGWTQSSRFAAKTADMNAYYHKNLLSLAEIARAAGRPEEAGELEARAAAVRDAVTDQLWDPQRRSFRDLGLVRGRWERLPAQTPFAFIPLYAGILPRGDARVAELVRQATDPAKFWTRYPLPTVAPGEPSYDPDGYWRGTSWVNVNYFVARGLAEHGYVPEARELITRTLEMVERGGMREYFNPRTAEGHRAKDFGWTAALVVELDDLLRRLPSR